MIIVAMIIGVMEVILLMGVILTLLSLDQMLIIIAVHLTPKMHRDNKHLKYLQNKYK
jgi:hypothetical protein